MSILTGSRVYGYPKEDSDVDLVVLVTEDEMKILCDHSDYFKTKEFGTSIKYGKLGLIATTDFETYRKWVYATSVCKSKGPQVKDDYMKIFSDVWGKIQGSSD